MKVSAIFHGIMSIWLGAEKAEFELPEKAVFADLLGRIGQQFLPKMPSQYQLWDDEKGQFTHGILATTRNRQIQDPQTPLCHGQEVKFFITLDGG